MRLVPMPVPSFPRWADPELLLQIIRLPGRLVRHACSRFQQPIWRWEESADAIRSYAVFFGILAAGLIPAVQVRRRYCSKGEGSSCRLARWPWRAAGPAACRRRHAGPISVLLANRGQSVPCPSEPTSPPPPLAPPNPQENRFADLPYFWGLASMTIYIGAHRALNAKQRQQISIKEGLLAPVAASGRPRLGTRGLAAW